MVDVSKLISVRKDNSSKRAQCSECPYYTRKFVPSYIANNEVVIIGEAPGQTEADTKVPFTGDSGQLLRKTLAEVGFDIDKITIMNCCKCHPPANEKPHKKAQELCTKLYLFNELQELKPKLVILAGATALNTFFPKHTIMAKAGSFIEENGLKFLPVLHPAYCLRNATSTPRLRKDLKKAFQYLNGGVSSDNKFIVVRTEEQLQEAYKDLFIKAPEYISVDIETNELLDVFNPTICLWTIGFCAEVGKCYSIPLDHPENENIGFREKCIEVSKEILNSNAKKIAHNACFDLKVLKKLGYKYSNFHADTMVMAFLLDENRYSIGLKQLTSEYLDGYTYEFTRDLTKLGLYNCEDVNNTLRLFQKFEPEIKIHSKMWNLFEKVLMPTVEVIVDMELEGVLIDKKYSTKLTKDLSNKLEAIYESIKEEFPAADNVNFGSPKQLSELLFGKLKYPVSKKTESGNLSTDNEVLEGLSRGGYKLATYLLKIRKYAKLLSTYVEKLPEIMKVDGKIHGDFNICGTVTGRLSSSGPNLQNIPRDKLVKNMFIASEGNVLLQADFSQAEIRVAGSIANESNIIKAYREGQDIHKLTASKIVHKPIEEITKNERQSAKAANFGFIYGSSAEGFQRVAYNDYGLTLSLEECAAFRKAYFESYPGLLEWYDRTKAYLRKYGYVEYPTGRMRRFPGVKGMRDIPNDVFRQAVNSPVQGSSSDIVLYTMVCLRNVLAKFKLTSKMILTVHDSIVLDAKKSCVEDIASEVNTICEINIPKQFPWLKVPMKFDFTMGPNWGNLEEVL